MENKTEQQDSERWMAQQIPAWEWVIGKGTEKLFSITCVMLTHTTIQKEWLSGGQDTALFKQQAVSPGKVLEEYKKIVQYVCSMYEWGLSKGRDLDQKVSGTETSDPLLPLTRSILEK